MESIKCDMTAVLRKKNMQKCNLPSDQHNYQSTVLLYQKEKTHKKYTLNEDSRHNFIIFFF